MGVTLIAFAEVLHVCIMQHQQRAWLAAVAWLTLGLTCLAAVDSLLS